MEFRWDTDKAESNLEKHGISFAEAMTILGDPLDATIPDPSHSEGEFRFLSWDVEGHVRLISAREATPKERRMYESDQSG